MLKPLPPARERAFAGLLRTDLGELASLKHPCLASPVRLCREGGQTYLARPYVEGTDVLAASRGKGERWLVGVLSSAARALALLHRFGLAHGNLKSANLLVRRRPPPTSDEATPAVALSDPAWWPSPGLAGAAHAADLRGLGAVGYSILTGRALDPSVEKALERPRKLSPAVSTDLERVILKLLQRDPRKGYESTDDLLADLGRLTGESLTGLLRPASCFLDREAELRRARALLDEARGPTAIAVTAEAGMGKSAFLERLALEAQVLGYRTVEARCYAGARGALEPLREVAARLIPPGFAGRSLRSRLRRLLEAGDDGPAPGFAEMDRTRGAAAFADFLSEAARASRTLVLIDDVHLAEPAAVACLAELARRAAFAPALSLDGVPAPPSIALAWRTEAPFLASAAPLREALREAGASHVALELGPLAPDAAAKLVASAGGEDPAGRPGARALSPRHPLALWTAVRRGGGVSPGSGQAARELARVHRAYLRGLDPLRRRILEALALLGRPASAELLVSLAAAPAADVSVALEALAREGTLREENGRRFFAHGSLRDWIASALDAGSRRALHAATAAALEARRDGTVEEAASHWLLSDAPRRGIRPALAAARRLARGPEVGRAIALYEAILGLLQRPEKRRRLAVSEEAAQACLRAGQHRRGAELLAKALADWGAGPEAGRIHAALGVLRRRAGDLGSARRHLRKAQVLLERGDGRAALRGLLKVESELAEVACVRGDYAAAEGICREALERLGRGRGRAADREVRRSEMEILETLANVELRRFRYREARELFERSLGLSDELGALEEKTLILNNLGILHQQESRFREAIACYRQAETIATRLGADQILVNILANLAVLEAKVGRTEAAEEALARAAAHEARCESVRSRFLRIHAQGMVELYLGRHGPAIEAFRAAIALGGELGDVHVVAFDLVYLGECHLWRGEARQARAAFAKALALGPALPPPAASMARARQALLAALRRDAPAARAALAAGGAQRASVPFVDAWSSLYRGWASRLLGRRREADRELEAARSFFAKAGIPAGEIHAELELAALEADRGKADLAGRRIEALKARHRIGAGPLRNPMLAARLLLAEARSRLDRTPPDAAGAASLLAEVEGHLIGRRLRDLEATWRELARRAGRLERPGPAHLESEATAGAPEARAAEAVSSGRPGARPLLVGDSPAMRELRDLVLQVARSRLPVLIAGETGSGKEVVARAIHDASARSDGPFFSVACAALPAELLEAELFGYRRGAFTGAEDDSQGLLAAARGGSFLFDEVGELPLPLQAKLLRALDLARVRPLGSTQEVEVDVRCLFATHRDLDAMARAGTFRDDLLYRLKVLEVRVPPLRERLEDLPALLAGFLAATGRPLALDPGALHTLAAHPWPGNVRELRNVAERLGLCERSPFGEEEVRRALGPPPRTGWFPPGVLRGRPLEELLAQLEKEHLLQLRADRGGDLAAMAASLGITVRALYGRFQRLGIRPGELG